MDSQKNNISPKDNVEFFPYVMPVPAKFLHFHRYNLGSTSFLKSSHYECAKLLADGQDATNTLYAREYHEYDENKVHGSLERFSKLIAELREKPQTLFEHYKKYPICGINRRGEIIIHDGMHRSAALLAVGHECVPVIIHYRDEDWVKFKYAVYELNDCQKKQYQPIFHPDFFNWPCWRMDTLPRADAIVEWLDGKFKDIQCKRAVKVWDIGCHSGAITHAISRAGYNAVGFERNPRAVLVAQLSSRMTHIGSDAKFNLIDDMPFYGCTVMICLSVFNHYYVRGNENSTSEFLKKFENAKYLIFDCPNVGDPVGGDTEFVNVENVVEWFKKYGIEGELELIAQKSSTMQRTIYGLKLHGQT